MYEIKSILVPVDFSTCSRAAFDRAMALASQLGGARVTLYHVAEVAPALAGLRLAERSGATTFGDHALAIAKAELETFLGQLGSAWRAKPDVKVEPGRPRECILREAKEGGYDLLVMGTHGRTGRVHALVGSVAESVVRMAAIPVLTVRESG
jgi:nucleotide-binding universal stress UspA family protein